MPFTGALVQLEAFDADCSPATLVFITKDERLRVPLHFHGGLDPSRRTLSGALLLPRGKHPVLVALRSLALGQDALSVELDVGPRALVLRRATLEWTFAPAPPHP